MKKLKSILLLISMSLIFTSCGFFSDEPAEPYIRDTKYDYNIVATFKTIFPDSVKHDNKKPIDIKIKGIFDKKYPFELDTFVTDNGEFKFKFHYISDDYVPGRSHTIKVTEISSESTCFDYGLDIRRENRLTFISKGSFGCKSNFYEFDIIGFTIYDN